MQAHSIFFFLALAMTGYIAGILAGLFGVGGGIIVPAHFCLFSELVSELGVSPPSAMSIAVETSPGVIVPTSISSARAHLPKGNIDLNILDMGPIFDT